MASLCNLASGHPPSQKDDYFFNHLGKAIDVYHQTYDKFLLIDDFHAEDTEPCLSQFFFFCMMQKIFLKKPVLKVKTILALLTFLLIVFKIHQQ